MAWIVLPRSGATFALPRREIPGVPCISAPLPVVPTRTPSESGEVLQWSLHSATFAARPAPISSTRYPVPSHRTRIVFDRTRTVVCASSVTSSLDSRVTSKLPEKRRPNMRHGAPFLRHATVSMVFDLTLVLANWIGPATRPRRKKGLFQADCVAWSHTMASLATSVRSGCGSEFKISGSESPSGCHLRPPAAVSFIS